MSETNKNVGKRNRAREFKITLCDEKGEKQKKSTPLELAERTAKLFSMIAIPILLAIGGWVFSSYQQNETMDQKHLQLAIDILSTPTKFDRDNLRTWAVSVLEQTSPSGVPVPKKMADALRNGVASLPPNQAPSRINAGAFDRSNGSMVGFSNVYSGSANPIPAINSLIALTRPFNKDEEEIQLDRSMQQQFMKSIYQLAMLRKQLAYEKFGASVVDAYLAWRDDRTKKRPLQLEAKSVELLDGFFETKL